MPRGTGMAGAGAVHSGGGGVGVAALGPGMRRLSGSAASAAAPVAAGGTRVSSASLTTIRLPQLTGPAGVPPGLHSMLTQPLQPKPMWAQMPSAAPYGFEWQGGEWWWNMPTTKHAAMEGQPVLAAEDSLEWSRQLDDVLLSTPGNVSRRSDTPSQLSYMPHGGNVSRRSVQSAYMHLSSTHGAAGHASQRSSRHQARD